MIITEVKIDIPSIYSPLMFFKNKSCFFSFWHGTFLSETLKENVIFTKCFVTLLFTKCFSLYRKLKNPILFGLWVNSQPFWVSELNESHMLGKLAHLDQCTRQTSEHYVICQPRDNSSVVEPATLWTIWIFQEISPTESSYAI
jgi:hypothetical protein